MTAARMLEVVRAGPRDLLQDGGRRARAVGAPVGGAADPPLWRLTQAVAGGPDGAAALEFALTGPTLRARGGAARVALGGAAGKLIDPGGEARALPPLRSATLAEGWTLAVGPTERAVGYLCVEGGFDADVVLGAASTDLRAGFGGWKGRALRAGDAVPVHGPPPQGGERQATPPRAADGPLRAMPGPQDAHFTPEARTLFFEAEWRVTPDVDRMGVRLEGPRLEHSALGADMTSEGLTIGAVQVPGAGQPIVLGVESHTIGGYPKIAVVISADIGRLGQLRPGDAVRFQAVSLAQARAAWREAEAALAAALAGVGPARGAAVDEAALRGANLIGGVVSAAAPRLPGALEEHEP
jgi:biotin-dependent carboxylase-like uncharacterized protein